MKYHLRWSRHGSHHALEARHLHDLFHYMTLQVKNPSNTRGEACFDESIRVLDISAGYGCCRIPSYVSQICYSSIKGSPQADLKVVPLFAPKDETSVLHAVQSAGLFRLSRGPFLSNSSICKSIRIRPYAAKGFLTERTASLTCRLRSL